MKKGNKMKIKSGDTIRYQSAAGELTAVVQGIVLDLNGAGKTIPWLVISVIEKYAGIMSMRSAFRLCATNDYLKQMKVEVL